MLYCIHDEKVYFVYFVLVYILSGRMCGNTCGTALSHGNGGRHAAGYTKADPAPDAQADAEPFTEPKPNAFARTHKNAHRGA